MIVFFPLTSFVPLRVDEMLTVFILTFMHLKNDNFSVLVSSRGI
jgi:hypothetical protein